MHKKLISLLKEKNKIKILVVRNDGLGDLITTLPLIAGLRKQLPQSQIFLLANKNLAPLEGVLVDLTAMVLDEGVLLKRHRNLFSTKESKQKYQQLLNEIRAYGFDMAILPYAEKKSAKLISDAKIPLRVGSGRRSFFWRFHIKNFQSRKNSNQAEFQLNLGYLKILGLKAGFVPVKISLNPLDQNPKKEKLKNKTILMHPYKRSGTALSWPMKNYVELASKLKNFNLTILGDPIDRDILVENFSHLKNCKIETSLSLAQLALQMTSAHLFIGNSSGPLHLAALCGCDHLGFFPKDTVSSKIRWQTIPNKNNMKSILLAPENNMQCIRCIGNQCSFYNCLTSIHVASVIEILQRNNKI